MSNLLPEFALSRLDTVHHCRAETLLNALPDASIDLVVTSPPYDNLRTYNGFTWDFERIACDTYRILKPGGVLVWVVGDATIDGSETLTSFRQALYFSEVGFKVWDTMIWRKFLPGDYGKRYCQSFEFMFVFSKGTVEKWNPVMRKNKSAGKWAKRNQRSGFITQNGHVQTGGYWLVADYGIAENVWDIPPAQSDVKHPAQFPEKLAEDHILSWSNPGDIVLDYFMGSGTTAKMARKHNRRYIGCDISAEYVTLARKRLDIPYSVDMFATLEETA